ncbi:MAG: hypothetical protein M1829_002453 [Trizodia sp. TS-e1964]|nr:MAG: hypothetical protein M1829_002453 [Trizodia sp. TS-e1964]
MVETDLTHNFGSELKHDSFKSVNSWVSDGISWLDDIQQFYRERSTIEKEYSSKLNALAKKYFEKKAKRSTTLSVGDTPTLTPGSLESASLTTWTTQLNTLESRASEHERFSSELISHLAEPLKLFALRSDEIRKSHVEYSVKLEKERDSSYADLAKVKGKYDAACQEVESKRKKTESSFDYSKQKAQNIYQQQILDMHNIKNTYLISINVTNRQKEKFYHEYIPDLLDSMQDLSEARTSKLNAIWSLAAQIESSMHGRSLHYLSHLSKEIQRNKPNLDSIMFARHNLSSWQEPPDKVFEPSPILYDDSDIITDETAKIFLRNILEKSKSQLRDLRLEVDRKRRDIEGLKRIRSNIQNGIDKMDEVELVRAILAVQEELHHLDRKRLAAEVEMKTITSAVGDVTVGGRSHNFKPQTFKIPTNCDLCGDRIWGLSAKGFDCRDCGYTCHSKCEMKIPADCPGELAKEEKKKLKIERQEAARAMINTNGGSAENAAAELPSLIRSNTMNSLSSGYAASANRSLSGTGLRGPSELSAEDSIPEKRGEGLIAASKPTPPRKNRVVAPPPSSYISELSASNESKGSARNKGKMIYAYEATGEGEISLNEGSQVLIVDSDDGSGWTKVRSGSQGGLVPSAYLEVASSKEASTDRPDSTYSNSSASISNQVKKKGPAVAPKRGARKLKYAKALYDYHAQSDAEFDMTVGEKFVLINNDTGDGWADVEKGGVVKSVPASYIEEAY